jgi:imidazolonepropionase-like amidohydrolase
MWAGNQGAFATPELVRMFRDGAAVGAVVTRDMWTAGVGVLAGCDGMVPGFCVHDELLAMVRGGMTPLAALQTATLNPRRYFNLPLMSGGVVAGERADLVLLAANPVSDINNTRRIRAVIAGGRVLDRKNLDNLLTDVKTAAAKR